MPNKKPDLNKFLNIIRQLESSGGIQTDHPIITKEGIQQGQKAIGDYALLPNTVRELVNRRRMEGTMTDDLTQLKDQNDEFISAYVDSDPKLQKDLAESLGKHVLSRQLGDEEKAAYAWNTGHNLFPSQIKEEDMATNPYVQKFRKVRSSLNKKTKKKK